MGRVVSRAGGFVAAVGGLAVSAVLLVGLGYGLTDGEARDIADDAERASELQVLSGQLSRAVGDQEAAVDDYLLSRDLFSAQRFELAVADETELTAAIRSRAFEMPELGVALSALDEAAVSWQTRLGRPALEAARRGDEVALLLFTSAVVNDHGPVDAAVEAVVVQIAQADVGIRLRQAALEGTRTTMTALGLGVLVMASGLAMWLIRRYGRALQRDAVLAGVLSRFTEATSFASDETAVAVSNLEALKLVAHPDASVTHVLNRSKDRAVPEAIMGGAIAEVLPLKALSRCAGMIRGSTYVTSDLGAPLSVHCPIYPVGEGTLACIPLNSGESVGAVHLYWKRPNALPLELQPSVARIAEHAALAIGNRRLLAVLRGQANTDPRTGLANSRAFDQALEQALATRSADEPLAVLMLDLDHFKDFNDRHGHPAGDEALRAVAGVLRSCMREGDMAARYGGEEFGVLLSGVDGATAMAIAERIRSRMESTIISLSPGITDRITVSVGVASAPAQGHDRVSLLRIADQALYRAKSSGRNRVDCLSGDVVSGDGPAVEPGGAAIGAVARGDRSTARGNGKLPVRRGPARAGTRTA